MKYEVAILGLASVASARNIGDLISTWAKLGRREVPQEHSHEAIIRSANTALQLNNPLEIQDTVFALLGNKAAAAGAPNVQNLDCLQQIIADQAFTNAKAAGDIDLMADAILFRGLERNTGSVGLASVLCTEQAVNPEIAAITQHQDPASPEASGNADIELAIAIQLAAIGADPIRALESATFAPGEIGDPTGAGNTCDDANDAVGCIFTLNLVTPAVSDAEIQAAVAAAGGAGGAANAGAGAAAGGAAACEQVAAPAEGKGKADGKGKAAKGKGNAEAGAGAGANAGAGAATGTVNVQAFTGALGGPPPPVESTAGADRPFNVNGATFLNIGAAVQRSCAVQKNACANAANSGALDGGAAQCDAQEDECKAANSLKRRRLAMRDARRRRQANDFGSCGSPAIVFAEGLDGRKEASFQSGNNADFNHGSALNIKIIADFTCQRLESSCKADAATVAACKQGAAAAGGAKGQAAADAFNAALGV